MATEYEVSVDAFVEMLARADRPVQVYAPAPNGDPTQERLVTFQPLNAPAPPPPRNRPPPKMRKDGSDRKERKRFFDEPVQCGTCLLYFSLISQYSGHLGKCTAEHPWDGCPSRSRSRILPGAISCGVHHRKRKTKSTKRQRDTDGEDAPRQQPQRQVKRARVDTEARQHHMTDEELDALPMPEFTDADLAMLDALSPGDADVIMTDVITPPPRGANVVRSLRIKHESNDPYHTQGAGSAYAQHVKQEPYYHMPPPQAHVKQESYYHHTQPPVLPEDGYTMYPSTEAVESAHRTMLMSTTREEYEAAARAQLDTCSTLRSLIAFDEDLTLRMRTIVDLKQALMQRILAASGGGDTYSCVPGAHGAPSAPAVALTHPAALVDAAAPSQGSATLMPRDDSMHQGFMSPFVTY